MNHPRLHAPGPLQGSDEVELAEDRAHYLTRVLRLGPGDAVTLFDGRGGEYEARIVRAERRRVTLAVQRHDAVERESSLRVRLIQAVSRGERMDTAVQKATELGVSEVLPVLSARAVVKLSAEQCGKRRTHWQAVAISACEQSQRNRVPVVHEPQPLARLLAELAKTSEPRALRLVLEPAAGVRLAALERPASISVLIGPEGGLHPRELAQAERAGFRQLRLGPRVLRTETAAIAALAAFQTLWGDLG